MLNQSGSRCHGFGAADRWALMERRMEKQWRRKTTVNETGRWTADAEGSVRSGGGSGWLRFYRGAGASQHGRASGGSVSETACRGTC